MKEKIHIENFGPIKDIKLDFSRVNILVGDQGSGRSTIVKLISIFTDSFLLLSNHSDVFRYKCNHYKIDNYFYPNTTINYSNNFYSIKFANNKLSVTIKSNFKKQFGELKKVFNAYVNKPTRINKDEYSDGILKAIFLNVGDTHYIPVERNLISTISDAPISFTKDYELPEYLLDFASDYEESRNELEQLSLDFLSNYTFKRENKIDFIQLKRGKKIKLSEAASGFQSLIPLIIVFKDHTSFNEGFVERFIIEEPETNLFPKTQYDLMRFLIGGINSESSLFITTHSPYVLSSLNNLMYAHTVGSKKKNVEKIIEKKYWINPNEVTTFMLRADGSYENIIDQKLGLIKVEKIDEISSKINSEFDQINDIFWENK